MPIFHKPEDAPEGLQRLLLRAVPVNEHGNKTMLHLSALMGLSRWAIQKWVINQRIPATRAMAVVKLSEGRVAIDDFKKYVFKDL